MHTTLTLAPGKPPHGQTKVALRVLLYQNELYRVPPTYRKLRVVSGTAFVTQSARDYVLGPGYETPLDRYADFALVSPLRQDPLVVELY